MRSSATAQGAHEPFAVSAPGLRDVTRRVMTGVEVLVEPAIGRHKQTRFDAVNALLCYRRRVRILQRSFPHQRVAVAVEHDDVRAGPMAMRLAVSAGLEFRDV